MLLQAAPGSETLSCHDCHLPTRNKDHLLHTASYCHLNQVGGIIVVEWGLIIVARSEIEKVES